MDGNADRQGFRAVRGGKHDPDPRYTVGFEVELRAKIGQTRAGPGEGEGGVVRGREEPGSCVDAVRGDSVAWDRGLDRCDGRVPSRDVVSEGDRGGVFGVLSPLYNITYLARPLTVNSVLPTTDNVRMSPKYIFFK